MATENWPLMLRDAQYAEEHFHNKVRWYTKKTNQGANDWCSPLDGNIGNVWTTISGNGTWGIDGSHDPTSPPSDEAFLFGTSDILPELGANLTFGDFDQVLFLTNTSNTVYLLRFIWGTGTMAAAIAAGQYSEVVFYRPAADNNRRIYDMKLPRIPVVGTALWAQCQNATDNATITFILGVHAYKLPGND